MDFYVSLKIWAKILVKTSWSYKKSVTDAVETASKRVSQETRDATGDLVASKIANKVTKCLPQNNLETDSQTEEKSIEMPKKKKRNISPGKRQQIIDDLRLI